MFEKNYKNAMENVTPSDDVKNKILEKIELNEEAKQRINPAIPWRIAFACVACIAIVLGIIFIPDNTKITLNNSAAQTLTVTNSYNDVYKIIKKNNTKKLRLRDLLTGNIFYGVTDEYVDEELEYESDVMIDSNTAVNENLKDDAAEDFSGTTEQVEGVSEADIAKTDGEYIYYLKGTDFSIFKADGENTTLLSKTKLSNEYGTDYGEMFLKNDRVIIMQTDVMSQDGNFVLVIIYDVSDPKNPKEVTTVKQEGWYNSSRMIGDYFYIISNCSINVSDMVKNKPETYVPTIETDDVCEPVPADSIYCFNEEYENSYTVIGGFNYLDGSLKDTVSLLGGTDQIYCSNNNIILTNTTYNDNKQESENYVYEKTTVMQLAINKGEIEYKNSGEIDGVLQNQFFIDEYNGYFRFVTTVYSSKEVRQKFANTDNEVISYVNESSACLTVLDNELKKVGEIRDLAKGERVYSVRFMGDIAYFVTFRETDPLFSADLSDPTNPKILGELKIPGFSEYMYPYGNGLLLGFGMDADENTGRTEDIKLSMFNIKDPANVIEQNKTLVEGFAYAPALNDHKAMLVQPNKNLIGFAATSNYNTIKYMIYEYTDEGFNLKAQLNIETSYKYAMSDIRGMFVGNEFYIVSDTTLCVFDMSDFSQIAKIDF